MQLKNSVLLLTALTAGSAVARLHGHERRHQHQERAVGTWVTATIDGEVVSWKNTYAGPTAAPAAATAAAAAPANAVEENVKAADPTTSSSAAATSASATATSTAFPTGFGGQTAPVGDASSDTYCGNLGIPYGSNMIRIAESELSTYDYTVTLDGSSLTEDYRVVFWNKCGSDDSMTGWYADTFPLDFTVPAGSKQYVAIDTDSQGAFIAIPASQSIPRDSKGGVTAFWGEFDMANSGHSGWSGFDVSAIQAQNAGDVNFPGLKLDGSNVISAIATDLGAVLNAYTSSEAAEGGIGGNIYPGPLALTATLGYSG